MDVWLDLDKFKIKMISGTKLIPHSLISLSRMTSLIDL